MIRVVGHADADLYPSHVVLDDDLPVEYMAHDPRRGLAGPLYIFVGPEREVGFELKVQPETLLVLSFIWVTGPVGAPSPFGEAEAVTRGLPILRLDDHPDFAASPFCSSVNDTQALMLCAPDRHLDIQFGGHQTFDHALAHGRVRYLIKGDELVGVRIADLSDNERRDIENFITSWIKMRS